MAASEFEEKRLDRGTVVTMTIVIEALLLLCATLWMFFGQVEIRQLLSMHKTVRTLAAGIGAGLLISLSNLIILVAARKWSDKVFVLRSMKDLIMKEMVPIFASLKAGDRLFIALISGFCEEIFFRGVLEKACGVETSALCFGVAHLPSIYYFPYAVWAVLVGLGMSALVQFTGSLWAAIFAHATINLISLNWLGRLSAQEKAQEEEE